MHIMVEIARWKGERIVALPLVRVSEEPWGAQQPELPYWQLRVGWDKRTPSSQASWKYTGGIAFGEQTVKITPLPVVNKQVLISHWLSGSEMKVSQTNFNLMTNPAQSWELMVTNPPVELPWHILAAVTHKQNNCPQTHWSLWSQEAQFLLVLPQWGLGSAKCVF